MFSDQSYELGRPERTNAEEIASSSFQPLPLQAFAVQLQNIVPIEIIARRFPVDIANVKNDAHFNLTGIHIDAENLQAQVVLDVKIEPAEEPHYFEISFKMVAIFTYESEYNPDMVLQFLQQESLSLMLPFARELVFSLCTRLQIPTIILALVQLDTPSPTQAVTEDAPQ